MEDRPFITVNLERTKGLLIIIADVIQRIGYRPLLKVIVFGLLSAVVAYKGPDIADQGKFGLAVFFLCIVSILSSLCYILRQNRIADLDNK